ncbi:MAG: trehalose-phosphatase [Phycisphaerae bacterium]|nr:trehalose-phosphatase [Phycisphaerae bacterium]
MTQATTTDEATLRRRIAEIARLPVLLVASDYDGTMAPIVDNPAEARPNRSSMVAMRSLAAMPNTYGAIVSGRALSDLVELTGEPDNVSLVGSHGSEFDLDFADSLDPEAAELRERVEQSLREISDGAPGTAVETKPASVAFHYRNADEAVAERSLEAIEKGPAAFEGVHAKYGKKVIELAVVATSKGMALNVLRHRFGASGVIFFGDDVTDEDAFVTLAGPDAGVKVGLEGETAARFRVADTDDVAKLLAQLCERRAAWLEGAEATPIASHSMLTDQRTVALVGPEARIVWLCVPRIDSPAIFAEILGGPTAGHFSVRPAGSIASPTQSYLGDSFVLKSTWPRMTVTDYLDCTGGRTLHRSGRLDLVRVIEGVGHVRVEFAPRLDFGRIPTRITKRPDGLVVQDTVDPIVLRAPGVEWMIENEGQHETAYAIIDLADFDGRCELDMRFGSGDLGPSQVAESKRRRSTDRFWSTWLGGLEIPDAESLRPDLIKRSALVLKGLCHGPTGAIAAAGTTSLPETIGGVRNWDYRFCWPRDASLSASALVRLGSTEEAVRFLDWMLGVVDELPSPDRLSPLYTVGGGEIPAEAEISELSGYAGSRPVRIGNAASRQLQLDVFGPIVELIHLLFVSGAPISSEHWRLVDAMVNAVDARWKEPDHGIWEIRGPQRHHVHSKVMCWQTVALGAELAERFHGRARPAWESLRDEIYEDIIQKGWSDQHNMFTGAYEYADPDASVLAVGLSGLLKPDDERFAATVRGVESTLREGDTVFRYRMEDGLPGVEGGFNICTGWLIESYALIGRLDDAKQLFEAYSQVAGPTGLMPEEIDPETGRGLGNHPQAYSHLALINAALRIEAAERS